ncbi:MAG TPA: hypothetical protein VGE74_25390 [Gemmata sp.]
MPIIGIPVCFLDRGNVTPDNAERRVVGRTLATIVPELFQRVPSLFARFQKADGSPSADWFGLYREHDGYEYDLRETPDVLLNEEERLHLINLVGC